MKTIRRVEIPPFIFWLPALFWMGLIFWGSSLPPSQVPAPFPHADLVFHFGEYFILSALVYFGLKGSCPKLKPAQKIIIWTLVFCLFYAASDEIHQFFVPGRQCDIFDFLVDSIGAAVFLFWPMRFFGAKKR